ncbi:MAG: 7TM diverse intracellular signaling domain-containing protein [Ketobacteraceae bacterium]|nr:7TM diverse intracellular signaling domain-containing protein [Ketobacteraceae bacterium]
MILCLGLLLANTGYTLKKPLDVQSLNALDVESSLNLNSTIVYIEDEGDHYTFQDILNHKYTDPLQQQAGTNFNIGISDSTYWFFFKLNHFSAASQRPVERLIEIPYPPLDRIDFFSYNYQTKEIRQYKSGDNLYFQERPIEHNNHVFPVLLEHNQEAFIAIRVKSKGSLRIPIKIWEPNEFHEHSQTTTMFMGMYFGIMLLMFFYNACIYVATKDRSYMLYIWYIGSLGLFQALMTGFAGEYLWPNTPILNDKLLNAFVLSICCSGILFVRDLLNLKFHYPDIDKNLKRIVIFNLVLIPVSLFLPYVPTLKYSIAVGILTAIFCLYVGIKLAIGGDRTARFFIVAWFCLLVAALIMGGVAIGIIPATVVTTNALLVGSAIEASLLSLTLADRMNTIQKQRAQAEKQAKAALEQANDALKESNRNKDAFLATISHELRTPMNGVLSCIGHLHEEPEESKRKKFLVLAEQSANHMMLLVDGVLSYAELQARRFVLNKDLFSAHGLMEQLEQQYKRLSKNKGISFRTEIKEDVPAYLFGDEAKILQVISNLADNAVKFTDSGYVKVTMDIEAINKKQQNADLLITVEDTGAGIPDGSEDLIFSKFRQLDSSNTRSHGGLGIGLSICKEIAAQMNASISYKSTLGEGTKFIFSVSLKYSMQPKESEEEAARRRYPLEELVKGKHALIAEDNPVNAMILQAILERIGLQTYVAANGIKTLEIMEKHPVDIVLMDCQMPEMDGLEATRKIRQMEGDKALVPIVAVTANATTVDRNRCIEAGMNDYLSKPLNRNELLEKLVQWLPLEGRSHGDDQDDNDSNSNVTPISPRYS